MNLKKNVVKHVIVLCLFSIFGFLALGSMDSRESSSSSSSSSRTVKETKSGTYHRFKLINVDKKPMDESRLGPGIYIPTKCVLNDDGTGYLQSTSGKTYDFQWDESTITPMGNYPENMYWSNGCVAATAMVIYRGKFDRFYAFYSK